MKVDMSPKAIKERLQAMNELWLLSVKLMNSRKIKSTEEKKDELSDHARDSHPARKED